MTQEFRRSPDQLYNVNIRQLLPVLIPLGSVLATILGVAVSFTKVQSESSVNAAQLAALDARLDRFQQAFDVMRSEAVRDNRDRDRLIERSAATNEAQNSRIDSLITALHRMEDYSRGIKPQNYDTLPDPLTLREAHK